MIEVKWKGINLVDLFIENMRNLLGANIDDFEIDEAQKIDELTCTQIESFNRIFTFENKSMYL